MSTRKILGKEQKIFEKSLVQKFFASIKYA